MTRTVICGLTSVWVLVAANAIVGGRRLTRLLVSEGL